MEQKRIVVVSSNNNPDYLWFIPYIEHAWNKLGWKVCVMVTHDVDLEKIFMHTGENYLVQLPDVKGLRTETIAQAGRLYAANYLPKDALIMTSDMDLLPLSDYWNPDPNEITVYGHDLTWHSYYPMGYIAMTGEKWTKHMNLTGSTERDLLRDAQETQIAFSEDWEKWWNFDWDLITKRLRPIHGSLKLIDRGQVNIAGATLAKGRVDRYNWRETMKQDGWIDAHCHNNNVNHPDKMKDFFDVFDTKYKL